MQLSTNPSQTDYTVIVAPGLLDDGASEYAQTDEQQREEQKYPDYCQASDLNVVHVKFVRRCIDACRLSMEERWCLL